jgi:hypothetical protein
MNKFFSIFLFRRLILGTEKNLIDIKSIGSFPTLRTSTLLILLTNNDIVCFESRFLLCSSKHRCILCGNHSKCFFVHQLLSSNNECVDVLLVDIEINFY